MKTIGDKVTVNSCQGTCEYLWNQKGTITKIGTDTFDNVKMFLVKFNKPVPSPAKYWPPMKYCWFPETGINQ